MTTQAQEPMLSVEGLRTEVKTDDGWVTLVDDVSFEVRPGEVLGLVGESGSGKSVTAMTLMGFIGRRRGQRVSGTARFNGANLLTAGDRELQRIRGSQIAMVFQEPMTSLDPAFKVGDQIAAGIRIHQGVTKKEAHRLAIEAMEKVRMPDAKTRAESYPHEFSGGMRQRLLIAMAIANNPSLLIADEPTTALDVSVQAQILSLLTDMQRELGLAMIFITHSMGVVADICDRVAVMYGGQMVEHGDVFQTFGDPQHPYTDRLLASMPTISAVREDLTWIPGTPPRPADFTPSCRFAARCVHRTPVCTAPTEFREVEPGRWNRCTRGVEWKQEAIR